MERAVAAMTAALQPSADHEWSAPAGDLDWSCWQTTAHVAHDLLAYACQVTARPRDAYLPLDLVVRPDASPSQLLQAVRTSASLLVLALDAADPRARAWHFGTTDPSGFAVLGVNELLVHAWDVCQGLGLGFEPPEDLARGVLDRLWTRAPAGSPWQVLLWCTGRVALPGHPRAGGWVEPSPAPCGDDRDW
ncbi:maleylpyruvate isomerase family mycothiol-dependent enzyme [Streptomyces sp. NP160]|nr:maleylpyruvate isomerase family mycothiol-dependent enzyme [Streptomyces sp. NP160]